MAEKPPADSKSDLMKVIMGAKSRRKEIAEAEYHKFWDTQPMRKPSDSAGAASPAPAAAAAAAAESGGAAEGSTGSVVSCPIEVKTVDEVRKEPIPLPEQLAWCTFDVNNVDEMREVYELLAEHYVEDDDNMFRFNYSLEFLIWALKSPGWIQDWHLGIRARAKEGGLGRLLAIITAVPVRMSVYGVVRPMVEINFLCVHQKLRSKRLAPALIKEITRRVNLRDIWQAVYTAGLVLPSPVAQCRYYHRSLNPKKLIEIGFSHLAPRMTMARTLKLYALPDHPVTAGLRPMEPRDVPAVGALLRKELATRALHPKFDDEEVAHWLLPRPDVVYSYVVERDGAITDLGSFYCLPSTVLNNPKHSNLRAAYSFYNVFTATPQLQLMNDMLILARNAHFDVFNMLDLMDNEAIIQELKFGVGDGTLQYYVYNWQCPEMAPKDVGLVLL